MITLFYMTKLDNKNGNKDIVRNFRVRVSESYYKRFQ